MRWIVCFAYCDRTLKPVDKDYKQSDAGGLYLKVLKSVASHQSLRATRLVLSTMCQSSRLMARSWLVQCGAIARRANKLLSTFNEHQVGVGARVTDGFCSLVFGAEVEGLGVG
ncbi:hypothetical protein MOLA814_02217 [Betaproteobacteria bacterium MOLA814]|nr:hypothetical protein MOLA814_02217 [Betaproteobacteria bacterium MOLA814]